MSNDLQNLEKSEKKLTLVVDEYNRIKDEINSLKHQIDDYEDILGLADEDEEIEIRYQIMKLNEKIPNLEKELRVVEKNRRKQQKIVNNLNSTDKLYKKLYIQDEEVLFLLCMDSLIKPPSSKEDKIKILMSNNSNIELNEKIDRINDGKNKGLANMDILNPKIKSEIEALEDAFSINFIGFGHDGTIYFETYDLDRSEYNYGEEVNVDNESHIEVVLEHFSEDVWSKCELPFNVEITYD